jgi:predicted adenylyl cyclase CyaB
VSHKSKGYNREIEIQVQVESTKKLLTYLKKNGKFVGKQHQIDQYFVPPHRDFASIRPINEWLRLRNSSGKYSINYKNWHRDTDGRSHYCDEYESPIGNLAQLQNIFSALNIIPLVTVDKVRKIWMYKNFEIAIDSVKGLKDSIEIEFKGAHTAKKPAEITTKMIKFLKDIGCGKIFRNYSGYPFRLLFPNEVKLEEY